MFKRKSVETNGQQGEVYAVETTNLTKIFQRRWIAANSISFKIPQGSIFGLVGPNGAGKSTTLSLILGLLHPTAGGVKVFGEPMSMYSGHLRRRIGYLPQGDHYPRDMTPMSYLELVGKLRGMPRKECQRRVSSLLHAVDLLGAASTRIRNLSAGMTTRMAIAASLVNEPDLLLWDEPTAGLDPTGRKYALDLIRELKIQGKTMIVSTHLLPDADHVCDYIGVLNQGKLVFFGSVREMKQFVLENVVDLELAGDMKQFQESLSADSQVLRWEQLSPDVIRVNFSTDQGFSHQLNRLMELVGHSAVELLSIRSGGELEDAFLKRLEADRLKGFNRVFDGQPSHQSQNMQSMMTKPALVLPEERVNGAPEVAEEQKV
ncbi:MAG: ABC transporter ATP-binding protein [Chloroflexi bacterium]|nr:ABC transporter ATP-binding protein [Chloroflexota bacterium]MCI0781854.1 ABC transporter ATP-binding protein [Chloroflexota bacterium]MCI0866149.1 ABC transporter ATP-binding protein [Chloroflexota bacterium]MCI0877886.1 ABC transporter ATP-binding protein [Chloroflexota bacterium]MCI0894615.1 ABC transporter ATP-binding protein [Chloroflexota bacterium]